MQKWKRIKFVRNGKMEALSTSSFSMVCASGIMIWFPENLMGLDPGKEHDPAFNDEARNASML